MALLVGLMVGGAARATVFADGPDPVPLQAPRDVTAEVEPTTTTKPPHDPKPTESEAEPEQTGGGSGDAAAAAAAIDDYASSLNDGTKVGVAIAPLDGSGVVTGGSTTSGQPWSVMKVPAAAAYLNFKADSEGTASGEAAIPEGSTERENLGLALVQSDNLGIRRPIQEMIKALGPDQAAAMINNELQAGGIYSVQVSPQIDPEIDSLDIGVGTWDLGEVAGWFRGLQTGGQAVGLSEDDRVFILRQLRDAPTALPWGAAASLDTSDIALKPGWGDSGGVYTTEQAVIVGNGDEADGFPSSDGGYVMVVIAQVPSSASAFTEGQEHLQEMASRVDSEMR